MSTLTKSAHFNPVWPRLALFGPILAPFALVIPVWPCFAPFGSIWSHLAPFGPILPCLAPLCHFLISTSKYFKVPIRQGHGLKILYENVAKQEQRDF